jgi:hypothetical protein
MVSYCPRYIREVAPSNPTAVYRCGVDNRGAALKTQEAPFQTGGAGCDLALLVAIRQRFASRSRTSLALINALITASSCSLPWAPLPSIGRIVPIKIEALSSRF